MLNNFSVFVILEENNRGQVFYMGRNKNKKFTTGIKRSFRKLKYLDKTQASYYIVTSFLVAFIMFGGVTYSYFTFSKNIGAATITIAKLNYSLESKTPGYQNDEITVEPGETKFVDIDLKSYNGIRTKYALKYTFDGGNVKVFYSENNRNNMQGVIGALGSMINMRVVVINDGSTASRVSFQLDGGYLQNTLATNITDGYFERELTVRAQIYDDIFENIIESSSFPDKAEYTYYKTECSNGVTATFDKEAWSLNTNDISKRTSCDVYFKKTTEEVETYYIIKGSGETRLVSREAPDTIGLYNYTGSTCTEGTTYTFDEATFAFDITEHTGNTVCVAEFETDKELLNADRLTIRFDPGQGAMTNSSKTVLLGGTYGNLPNALMDGYRLEGWYTSPSGGDRIESTTPVTSDSPKVLYAHWVVATNYTVTFDAAGGSFADGTTRYVLDNVEYGTDVVAPSIPVKTGYTFSKWVYADGTEADTNHVTEDKIVYAEWQANE